MKKGQKCVGFRPNGYQFRVKSMLFLGQEYINFGPRDIRNGSKVYQFRTTGYQKWTKKMLVSDHVNINFRSQIYQYLVNVISEKGQTISDSDHALYQKKVKSISEMDQPNINFRSGIYQFRVRGMVGNTLPNGSNH